MSDSEQPIVIKKVIKKIEGGHHGGAWKVAYADFVTAMMAFFMLLWLLNVAPPETLNGLADYFSPTTAAVAGKSGSQSINPPRDDARGDNPSPVVAISVPGPPPSGQDTGPQGGGSDAAQASSTSLEEALEIVREYEDQAFREFQEQVQVAIQESPTLADLKDQVIMEITEEGLKIQIIDKDRRSMFKSGSDELYGYAADLICEVSGSVKTLQNRVTVEGHTDSDGLTGNRQTGWELSANRANAARRKMAECGVSNDRVAEVIGKATTDPIYPDQPNRTENRRITLLLLREAPVVPPGAAIN